MIGNQLTQGPIKRTQSPNIYPFIIFGKYDFDAVSIY